SDLGRLPSPGPLARMVRLVALKTSCAAVGSMYAMYADRPLAWPMHQATLASARASSSTARANEGTSSSAPPSDAGSNMLNRPESDLGRLPSPGPLARMVRLVALKTSCAAVGSMYAMYADRPLAWPMHQATLASARASSSTARANEGTSSSAPPSDAGSNMLNRPE